MQQIMKGLLCAVLFAVGFNAQAASQAVTTQTRNLTQEISQEVPQDVAGMILAKLQAANPTLNYGPVKPSPVPGFYLVQVEYGPALFVNASGDFLLIGNLLGVTPDGFVDLVEVAMRPERQARLAAVPDSEQIIFPAKGKRKGMVYIFTDVDCGYCRKQHQEVPALNARGIEVRYLAYPREGLDSPAYRKMAAAWCSKTPGETLTRIKSGLSISEKPCDDNPIAEQFRLGGELGVRGTPALFLGDGQMLPGYTSAANLAEALGL